MKTPQINACLCEMTISVWTARKLDKKVSHEVTASKGANSDDAARVNKNLFAGMDNLKRITDFVALTRADFYRMTLPWSDLGQRLVPMAQFFELNDWAAAKRSEFENMVQEFINEYPTLISAQAFQLGALFDRNEYPSVEEVKQKFGFNLRFLPLPAAGDFRVDATTEVVDELRKEYERMFEERVTAVNNDLWNQLYDTLRHMSDRLGYNEDGTKKIFRDSMVTNAVELCDLLKRLNVTNDEKLEKARAWLESTLLGVDTTELRKDGARDEIKSKVDTALSSWFA